jgi:hypothetical protein
MSSAHANSVLWIQLWAVVLLRASHQMS